MMRPLIFFLTLLCVTACSALGVGCTPRSPAKTVVVVNFVDHPVLNTIQSATIAGIRRRYSEQQVSITTLSAQGRPEDIPRIAEAAKSQDPDLIVTISTPVSQGVMHAISDRQPIVYTFVTDPSNLGDSLTRTNNTGLSDAVNYADNLALIRTLFGDDVTIGFAYSPSEPNSVTGLQVLQGLVAGSRTRLLVQTIQSPADIPTTIASLAAQADVIYVGGDNTLVGAFPAVVRAAATRHVPVIASDSGSIEQGAVAGVSVDYDAFGERTAETVLRVLSGTDPRNIPRVTIPGDRLIVNLRAASAIGFNVPESVVARADQVIR